jgi:polysaccharide biosynthesis/export protein
MKSSMNLRFSVYLLIALISCGSLRGQTTTGSQDVAASSGAVVATSSAQSDTPQRSTRSDNTYIIGNDDLLSISVWKEPDLTKQVPVRSDGKISLPLIGDIQAAGRTPSQLEQDIADRLKAYITNPQVSVIVQEIRSENFNILGQVTKPGSYPLASGTTVVDAIAIAGGFKDFAKKKGVYVLRRNPAGTEFKYSFNYEEFIKGKNTKQNIMLKPHDTVIVP